ncbi:type I methionyl aminopeptidase [Brevibacillus sp. 7WMA2]|uniref:Methionine aminopeptidase n=1 Tax=Brevibacillus laterosporus LMG 15441 TaxID=1042163 RepID=A0A075QZG7_BRELA|nr:MULTISPECIES: type I methionyl aminopeptidase [Brevibacillus]AIG24611.1 methionine aminopeptidase 1 [Brevibacillus laterosporus LMG 15441]AUM63257.1 type I methionyl aminopeptidase [Brevibacillus laterosporus]AYK06282.1 type I methionyl aminopeptidase [Brevibacillus laterosporus]ERM18368.1 methionine aminopeptidase [Brevibacillus laterosporus PE36]MBA4534994.1 type I methionyl aminopeptidase [Brevibacillus halotolerans]
MINIKSKAELEIMREAGRIVALTHQQLANFIKPGVTTKELDELAETFIRSHNAIPSFKGYGGFTGSICASVNEELVHGIPGKRALQEGDIISIDIGAKFQGYHGDSAWTYAVGNISVDDQRLMQVTEESLYKGLAKAIPDGRLSDISHEIQLHAEAAGYSIVREYVGHGIGQSLHEDPQIPNYGSPNRGPRLKPGMVLAIEPMVNAGERYVRTLEDNWTVVTVDGKKCAHYEHTIAITEDGYEILTRP